MPIQKTVTIEFEVSIKAALRDEAVEVTMTVAAPYGNDRKAAVVVKEFSDDAKAAIKTALQAAVEERLDDALHAAQAKASEALALASARGEL